VSAPARLLVICTGNVCRSPAAVAMLRQAFPAAVVTSAGTRAAVGAPADERIARIAEAHGLLLWGHRAAQLTRDLVAESDLVLTAAREHRSAAVALVPGALRRSFTLRELARLVPLVPDADRPPVDPQAVRDGTRLVQLAAAAVRRRHANPHGPELDDLVDPIGRPLPEVEAVYAGLDLAVGALVTEALAPVPRSV
jgi:protein-tyrosine phosphatase